jgi:response regulator RpfG family c-di-GMP phosphodiesterase
MSNRVLVVDDDRSVRNLIAGLLRRYYEVVTAASGEEALALVAQLPPAVVLLDIVMPGIDGYETCRRLKTEFAARNIQVIMLSAASSAEEQSRAFELGADAYMVKPFDPFVLCSEVRSQFRFRQAMDRVTSIESEIQSRCREIERLVEDHHRHTSAMEDCAVFALAKVAESRDDDTGEHLIRVRSYSQVLAAQLGRDSEYASQITAQFLNDLYRTSPLHDIGKVAISDAILLKAGRLTPQEFEIMKTHTVLGAKSLEQVVSSSECGGFLAMAVAVAKSHHERFDGTGYPEGLQGRSIPLPARIVAVADVFDALTSTRPYKPAYSPVHARRIIGEEAGTHFDPAIVTAFEASFEEFLAIHDSNREGLAVTGPTDLAMETGFAVGISSQENRKVWQDSPP